MHGLSPAQHGARVLRGLACPEKLVCSLVQELTAWRPWGSLEEDDLWAIAITTTWGLLCDRPSVPPAYIRQCVHWAIVRAFDGERRSKGWRRLLGGPWLPPQRVMHPPEWDWGRPFRLVAA